MSYSSLTNACYAIVRTSSPENSYNEVANITLQLDNWSRRQFSRIWWLVGRKHTQTHLLFMVLRNFCIRVKAGVRVDYIKGCFKFHHRLDRETTIDIRCEGQLDRFRLSSPRAVWGNQRSRLNSNALQGAVLLKLLSSRRY